MDVDKIGKLIRELREQHNYSQQELADMMLINRESVSKWERGINFPDQNNLIILSEVFDVSINEILAGELKTESNKDKIDNFSLKIIEYFNNKLHRFYFASFIIILILIISFFVIYFISNFNSIKVYNLFSDDDDYLIESGMIFTSKDVSYLLVGSIKSDKEINNIKIYYDDYLITESDSLNNIFISLKKFNDKYKIRIVINNTDIISIGSYLYYSNNYVLKNSSDDYYSLIMNSRKNVIDKFKNINDEYVYQFKEFTCNYYKDTITCLKDENEYIYSINKMYITINVTNIYSIQYGCVSGECDSYIEDINMLKNEFTN